MPPATAGSPCVGRERELGLLHEALAAARRREGGVVLVAGAPGIGKTHLAAELAAVAERDGVMVLWGRCSESEGVPPFWPWLQVLSRLREQKARGRLA